MSGQVCFVQQKTYFKEETITFHYQLSVIFYLINCSVYKMSEKCENCPSQMSLNVFRYPVYYEISIFERLKNIIFCHFCIKKFLMINS